MSRAGRHNSGGSADASKGEHTLLRWNKAPCTLYARGGRFLFPAATLESSVSYVKEVEIVPFLIGPFLITLRQMSSISYGVFLIFSKI